jgi:hypothetical protein
MNKFFMDFYTKLKAMSNFVPFLFITGSSRIGLVDFFGGANDITDLTYDAEAAASLGYTWAEIETLYFEQLPLLQQLHDMTRDELKAKMERWYGGYRWSQDLDVSVFNPLSVNQFVGSGTFQRHWTSAGTSSLVFNKRLFDRDMMRLLLVKGARVELWYRDMFDALQVDMSTRSQVALLVSRGVLSLAPECSVHDTMLPLYFPNVEARSQAEAILRTTFYTFFESGEVDAAVRSFSISFHRIDAVEMLVALDACEAVAKCASELASHNNGVIKKEHVHHAIAALVLGARQGDRLFSVASELGDDKGAKEWLDLVFAAEGRGYAIVLKCCEEPNNKCSESEALCSGLERLRSHYESFALDGVAERFYSCFLYGKDGRVVAYTKSLLFSEIAEVQRHLTQNQTDERVVWRNE